MTDILKLPINALAAALTHAANKDFKSYMNGIYLDFRAGRIAATDGYRLFIGQIPQVSADSFIIPRAAIESLLRLWRALPKRERVGALVTVRVTVVAESPTVQLTLPSGAGVTCQPIDCSYPDYMAGVPKSLSGEAAQVNSEYLREAHASLCIYAGIETANPKSHTGWNGDRAILVTRGGVTAVSVVMPMRVDPAVRDDASWLLGAPIGVAPVQEIVA